MHYLKKYNIGLIEIMEDSFRIKIEVKKNIHKILKYYNQFEKKIQGCYNGVSLYLDKKNQITYLNCGKSSRGKSARYPRDTQGIENIPNKSIKTPAEKTRFCLNIKYNQQRRIHEDIFTPISSRNGKIEYFAPGTRVLCFFYPRRNR